MRYNFDKLGWYEFEGLVQTLLKARLGLGVEAWGGSGDLGRDAYHSGRLAYPTLDGSEGPFLFQCKFVNNAQGAGARPGPLLLQSVQLECEAIKRRLAPPNSKSKGRPAWPVPPATYVLITNARVGVPLRKTLASALHGVLPGANIIIHDGQDLCAWLDLSHEVVRAFPLLWSLRDIQELLRQWVHNDVITRSSTAVAEGRDIANVFVPTHAYSKALEVLGKHQFVVLEGPPEMGKTAIGRMISLSLIARGWDAVECHGPQDVIKMFDRDVSQVFVADDFFGRTEYDPRRVSAWQDDLSRILRLLDPRHWLILTTRAHLLNLAKLVLDIPPGSREFPGDSEVVVQASHLEEAEKARILYRHLKQGGYSLDVRIRLRTCASAAVKNPHFTPERIRRLAADHIPALLRSSGAAAPTLDALQDVIIRTLRDPTTPMRVSFRNLRPAEKWLLFAFVEVEMEVSQFRPHLRQLETSYERLCPSPVNEPFRDVLAAMSDAFIKYSEEVNDVWWIHPSCRDLAISELSTSATFRRRFLRTCSTGGFALAVSIGGGADGSISLPLLARDDDWRVLTRRAIEKGERQFDVLTITSESYFSSQASNVADARLSRLKSLLFDTLWPHAAARMNEDGWTVELLELYHTSDCSRHPGMPIPDLELTWRQVKQDAINEVESGDQEWESGYALSHLCAWANLFERVTELNSTSFRQDVQLVATKWLSLIERERRTSYGWGQLTASQQGQIGTAYLDLARALGKLLKLTAIQPFARTVDQGREYFESIGSDLLPGEPDYDDDDRDRPDIDRDVAIDSLFVDL